MSVHAMSHIVKPIFYLLARVPPLQAGLSDYDVEVEMALRSGERS